MSGLVNGFVRLLAFAVMGLALTLAVPRHRAEAASFQAIYEFCSVSTSAATCADGSAPSENGRLALGPDGTLYGTTGTGGTALFNGAFVLCGDQAAGCGTVFALAPPKPPAKTWTETVLYSFCGQPNCIDGAYPLAGVVLDAGGNLFGTTWQGGDTFWEAGSVFALFKAFGFVSLYGSNDLSIGMSLPAMLEDGDSGEALFVATQGGGNGEAGSVFTLTGLSDATVLSGQTTPLATTIYADFCSVSTKARSCLDGSGLTSGVTETPSATLVGMTTYDGGSVYQLAVVNDAVKESALLTFCPPGGAATCDARENQLGAQPQGGLIADAHGNLYGVAQDGGKYGGGTVFELSLDKTTGSYQALGLYSFCAVANCTDGANPHGGLAMDAAGNLYGTTLAGGNYTAPCPFVEGVHAGCGTVFKLTPRVVAGRTEWRETVLHRFCNVPACRDGAYPYAGLTIDGTGHLFGTTSQGGIHAAGMVFEISP